MLDRLRDAIDFAMSHGLMKRMGDGWVKHAPFTLTSQPISQVELDRMIRLTPLFNEVMLKVSDDIDFLSEQLDEVGDADEFTGRLLKMLRVSQASQPAELLLSRSDYIPSIAQNGESFYPAKQVEFNMISNGFPFMATQTYQLHKYLFNGKDEMDRLVENKSVYGYVDAMAETLRYYDTPNSCVLAVVQPNESNIFDQRALEYDLIDRYGYPTIRKTLEEVASEAKITDGHLTISDRAVGLVYFRAGYTPADYKTEDAWKGRQMIEASSAIKCPTIAAQLAGTKKIQQVLTQRDILSRFGDVETADLLRESFVGIYAINEKIDGKSIKDIAVERSEAYVLKPQREGGGNNLYDAELVRKIKTASEDELRAFVIMEKINPRIDPITLVVEGRTRDAECISEIGRYGACLKAGQTILFNQDCGYLVRSKASDVNEGGVSAGFACLNSLILEN